MRRPWLPAAILGALALVAAGVHSLASFDSKPRAALNAPASKLANRRSTLLPLPEPAQPSEPRAEIPRPEPPPRPEPANAEDRFLGAREPLPKPAREGAPPPEPPRAPVDPEPAVVDDPHDFDVPPTSEPTSGGSSSRASFQVP